MTISETYYTSNLIHSFYDELLSVVGSTYTLGSVTKTITFLGGWPPDLIKYKNDLPLVIVKHLTIPPSSLIEMGGQSDVFDNFVVSVIAGGLEKEAQNEFMKFYITDKIRFGFNERYFNLKNIQNSEAVEGLIESTIQPISRPSADEINEFENHRLDILIQLKTQILI